MMPCFEPFFGPKDNVMSSMAPPIVIARGTETTKNIGKLRSLLADKRVTGERTDKRSTPLTIINGIVSFAPSKSNVRIMVCPERWKEAGSEETFVERWLACKEKEPNEGVFPKVRLSFCVIRFLSIIFFFLSQEFFSLRTDAPRAFGRRRSSAL